MFCMQQIVEAEKKRKEKQSELKGCKGITKSGKPCKNGVKCKIHKGVNEE